MKKQNIATLSIFAVVIIAVIIVMIVKPAPDSENKTTESGTSLSVQTTKPSEPVTTEKATKAKKGKKNKKDNTTQSTTAPTTKKSKADYTMDDALLIGDSRTVGISEYGEIDGADFFCNVGMSIYNISSDTEDIKGLGKVTVEELLSKKKYGKIFLMMGVNEVGYNLSTTIGKYEKFIAMIKEKQPDAVIILQANLHVTKSRSDSDSVVNNKAINNFNAELAKMADNKTIYYIDANEVFDDSTGSLDADKTADSTHILAKYYKQWGTWIVDKSAEVLGYE